MIDHVGNAAADNQPDGDPEAWLAGLVAARICHDLVGPVGAIANGVDLVRELGAAESEDLTMIADSAERAAVLLRLHRLAFGWQTTNGDRYGRPNLQGRLAPVIGCRRVEFVVGGIDGPPLAPTTARVAALMALAGRSLAGAGGRVRLDLAPDGDLPVALTVEGGGLRWSAETEALVRERNGPSAPGEVEFALLPHAARVGGARIESRAAPGEVRLLALAA